MGDKIDVLVVGADPTGLVLASELFRRGVATRLIDAHDASLEWYRATVMHPRSLEIVEYLGLLDRFLSSGVKQRAVTHRRARAFGTRASRVVGVVVHCHLGLVIGRHHAASFEAHQRLVAPHMIDNDYVPDQVPQ